MEIRQATSSDSEAICRLNAEVQSVHAEALPYLYKAASDTVFRVDVIRDLLGKPETLLLLALVDGEAAGYAYAQLIDGDETPYFHPWKRLYLHHISIDRAHQSKGVGRALLDKVVEAARRQGVKTVAADFWSFNDKARWLFSSAGFRPYNECVWLQLDDRAGP